MIPIATTREAEHDSFDQELLLDIGLSCANGHADADLRVRSVTTPA